MADAHDVIVIGGGPGGYVAAIRAAQLGLKTAVVERDKAGGRCLNYACIPAKTMLYTAELYDHAEHSAELGVKVSGASLDWAALGERRTKVSATLSGGVEMLWKKNKVDVISGHGSLTADANVQVGDDTYETGAVVLATGSVAMQIPGVEFADRVVDTWGAWSLPEQPKSIAVVGAGASGAEIASAYIRYGTAVTLIEMLPQILPAEDKDIVRVVERTFKKQGIEILTGTPISDVEAGAKSVKAKVGDAAIEVDYLCIAGGRRPDTEGSASTTPGSGPAPTASSRSTSSSAPRTPRCLRSATSSGAARSPTRRWRKASSRSKPSPAPPPIRVDVEPRPRGDVLSAAGGKRRDDRSAGEGDRARDQGRQVQARRGRRLGDL